MIDSIKVDFNTLEKIQPTLDSGTIEYIYHKFFNNPEYTYSQSLKDPKVWKFPECWLTRYWCYYVINQQVLQNARVLDIGANFNFYGVWALDAGASSVHGIEPDVSRFALGKEYVDIKNYKSQYQLDNWSVNQFMDNYKGEQYDVVFLLDMIYFLTNGIELLQFIKDKVKPKFVFLESTIVQDHSNTSFGHFKLFNATTQSNQFSAFDPDHNTKLSLMPSKNALRNIIELQGWKIICYYDYLDFIGHGESLPRKDGRTNFYVLENIT
jgi:2-polyprenyl-3-methyl-5-hydroxy-6-metoxy-1,4-benzoquinol methylase